MRKSGKPDITLVAEKGVKLMTAEKRTGILSIVIRFWFGLMLGTLIGSLWLIIILASNLAASIIRSYGASDETENIHDFVRWINRLKPFDEDSENWGFRTAFGIYAISTVIWIISAF